ncbi:MAG: ABC transporter ATP-binding protein, partial [Elusimicrobia bacterium]|nr:ABC transporter ATP-binding protein [Elusimicrobiota bacterium]
MRLLGLARALGSRFPRRLAAVVFILTTANLLDAASMLALAAVVDLFARPDMAGASRMLSLVTGVLAAAGLPTTLPALAALFVVLFTSVNLLQIAARWLVLRLKYAVLRDLYLATLRDFFQARWPFFSSSAQGTLVNTFLREMTVVGEAYASLGLLLSSVVQAGVYLAIPLLLSWKLTLACLAATGLCALPFAFLGRWSYRLGQRNTETSNRISQVIHESFALAKLVLGFGNGARAIRSVTEALDAHIAITVKLQVMTQSIANLYHPLAMLVLALALIGAQRLGVPLGETALLLLSMVKIIPAIGQIATHKNAVDGFLPSHEQIDSLRRRARELRQPAEGRPFPGLRRELRLEGVTFAHPGREPALRDLS